MVWDAGNHPVESGIWTPKSISGLTITQVGGSLYCRMGDMCFCYMDLSIGPYIGDNPIAQAILSGIPYPNVWPPYAALFLGYGGQGVSGIIGPGGTINLTLDGRYMTNSETDRFTQIIFSFSYKISQ